ncbi:hypothetical protein [Aureimonas sp. ME7]|uniref:hypothetical protein n=1 Tax=Aureimonas sp. ME7 TaxID=2744252 RepID=UPI0015F763F7|nr:hypothetical protein [Aureimonas sp. ME7]
MGRRVLTRRRFVGLLAALSATGATLALGRTGRVSGEADVWPATRLPGTGGDGRDLVPLALPRDGALWAAPGGALLLGQAGDDHG